MEGKCFRNILEIQLMIRPLDLLAIIIAPEI